LPSCSTRRLGHMPNISLTLFKAAVASFGVEAIAAPVYDTSELESVAKALGLDVPLQLQQRADELIE
jgi:hypothetical protein